MTAAEPGEPNGCNRVCDRRTDGRYPAVRDYTSVCSAISSAVIDLDPEVSDGALKFRMAEQYLNGPKMAER